MFAVHLGTRVQHKNISRCLRKIQKYRKATQLTRKSLKDFMYFVVYKNIFETTMCGKKNHRTIKSIQKKIQRNWKKIDNAQNFAIKVIRNKYHIHFGYFGGKFVLKMCWYSVKHSIESKRSTEIINKLGQSILGQPQITFALKCFACGWRRSRKYARSDRFLFSTFFASFLRNWSMLIIHHLKSNLYSDFHKDFLCWILIKTQWKIGLSLNCFD